MGPRRRPSSGRSPGLVPSGGSGTTTAAPTPASSSGRPAFPYWSSEARAQRAAELWGPAFRAVPMPLDHGRSAALPDLAEDDLRVGINWSGPRLTGWDFTVTDVVNRLAHALAEPPYGP
ncbi:DUF2750 domain-containing protein [Streptomyces sp. NPDC004822]